MYCSRCRHLGTDEYHQLHCWLRDLDPEYIKICKDRDLTRDDEYESLV